MTSHFPIQKERRVSITLLFIGMIVISKAYQPSSRFCNPITTHRHQRSFHLNSLIETNKKELTAKSSSDEVSDETGVKGNSIDTVRDIPSSPIFERVQRSLARLTEIVPRPVTLAVVAVASSLLLFELSKTLLFLAVPVIAVLGGLQSLKEGLTNAAKGPRVYDTEVVEFASSSSNNDDYSEQNKSAMEWANDSTSRSLEELEKQSRERSGRLAAIQRRISETSGDLRNVITSASTLREKLTTYADKIDRVDASSRSASKSG